MLNAKKIEWLFIDILLILMPFHYLICERILSGSSVDNIWRDILILGLFLLLIASLQGKIRVGYLGRAIVLSDLVVLLFLLFASNYSVALNISRTYIMPTIMYFIMANIHISEKNLEKWIKIIIVTAVVVSVYGLFQTFVLGDSFLVNLGYPSVDGHLVSSYYINGFFGNQRLTGTLVSPNICGVFLGICLFIVITSSYFKIGKKLILSILIGTGLICTFSRSAILAFVVAIIFYFSLTGKLKLKKIKIKYVFLFFSTLAVLIPILLYIDQQYLNGIVSKMLISSSKLTDLSAAKHYEDLFKPLNTVISHPFGLGFGSNGPKAVAYNGNVNLVESSLYLSMYDFGIIGAVLFLFPYIKTVAFVLKKKNKKYVHIAASISIFLVFTFLLLPNIQEYEPLFYFYFLLGIANNKSVD